MFIDILVLLNNFVHDLSAAMWFCGTCAMLYIVSEGQRRCETGNGTFVHALYRKMLRLTHISLAFVFAGGIVRALAFSKYEWIPAMGREQVSLLIVKHVLLIGIVAGAFWLQTRLSKQVKRLCDAQNAEQDQV